MSKVKDNRFPLRLDDLTRWKIECWYERDNCASRNDFVIKAVNFYADYLAGRENTILPNAIQSAIDGRLGIFEDRVAKLLFKLAVEADMGLSTLLDCVRIDEDYLRKQRAASMRNVKSTNGLLTFEQKVREQEEALEEGDAWQD